MTQWNRTKVLYLFLNLFFVFCLISPLTLFATSTNNSSPDGMFTLKRSDGIIWKATFKSSLWNSPPLSIEQESIKYTVQFNKASLNWRILNGEKSLTTWLKDKQTTPPLVLQPGTNDWILQIRQSGQNTISYPIRTVRSFRGMQVVTEIGTFREWNVAIRSDDSLWIWKGNQKTAQARQIGRGYVRLLTGPNHMALQDRKGNWWLVGDRSIGRWQAGKFSEYETIQPVKIQDRGIQSINFGDSFAILTMQDGSLQGIGSNNDGQLGLEPSDQVQLDPIPIEGLPPIRKVTTGDAFVALLDTSNQLWTWGSAKYGQLLRQPTNDQPNWLPTKVASDIKSVCATGVQLGYVNAYDEFHNTIYGKNSIKQQQTARYATDGKYLYSSYSDCLIRDENVILTNDQAQVMVISHFEGFSWDFNPRVHSNVSKYQLGTGGSALILKQDGSVYHEFTKGIVFAGDLFAPLGMSGPIPNLKLFIISKSIGEFRDKRQISLLAQEGDSNICIGKFEFPPYLPSMTNVKWEATPTDWCGQLQLKPGKHQLTLEAAVPGGVKQVEMINVTVADNDFFEIKKVSDLPRSINVTWKHKVAKQASDVYDVLIDDQKVATTKANQFEIPMAFGNQERKVTIIHRRANGEVVGRTENKFSRWMGERTRIYWKKPKDESLLEIQVKPKELKWDDPLVLTLKKSVSDLIEYEYYEAYLFEGQTYDIRLKPLNLGETGVDDSKTEFEITQGISYFNGSQWIRSVKGLPIPAFQQPVVHQPQLYSSGFLTLKFEGAEPLVRSVDLSFNEYYRQYRVYRNGVVVWAQEIRKDPDIPIVYFDLPVKDKEVIEVEVCNIANVCSPKVKRVYEKEKGIVTTTNVQLDVWSPNRLPITIQLLGNGKIPGDRLRYLIGSSTWSQNVSISFEFPLGDVSIPFKLFDEKGNELPVPSGAVLKTGNQSWVNGNWYRKSIKELTNRTHWPNDPYETQ